MQRIYSINSRRIKKSPSRPGPISQRGLAKSDYNERDCNARKHDTATSITPELEGVVCAVVVAADTNYRTTN